MSFRDRKRSGDLIGYIIMGIVSLICISIAYFFFSNESKKIKIDPITFCPKDKKENFGKTVALLDLTDPLNKAQKEFFLKEIEELKDQIPKHYSLTIYTLDEDLDLGKSIKISMCNPGTVEDIKGAYDKISINPNEIKKKWEEGFSKQISDEVNNIIIKENSQNTSPVMEMFQLIALKEFKGFKGTDNKIIILSDMLQNTSEMSMYQDGLVSYPQFSKTENFLRLMTSLNYNVSVEIFLIQRDGFRKMQDSPNFYNFWGQYFMMGNGAKDDFVMKKVSG